MIAIDVRVAAWRNKFLHILLFHLCYLALIYYTREGKSRLRLADWSPQRFSFSLSRVKTRTLEFFRLQFFLYHRVRRLVMWKAAITSWRDATFVSDKTWAWRSKEGSHFFPVVFNIIVTAGFANGTVIWLVFFLQSFLLVLSSLDWNRNSHAVLTRNTHCGSFGISSLLLFDVIKSGKYYVLCLYFKIDLFQSLYWTPARFLLWLLIW